MYNNLDGCVLMLVTAQMVGTPLPPRRWGVPHACGKDFRRRGRALVDQDREGGTLSLRPRFQRGPALHGAVLAYDEHHVLTTDTTQTRSASAWTMYIHTEYIHIHPYTIYYIYGCKKMIEIDRREDGHDQKPL